MYVDEQLLFSNAQAITAAAGSTNTIDWGVAGGRDVGTGEPLYVVLVVDTTLDDSGDDSTLTVALEGDSTESFTPDATDTLFTLAANAAAGTVKIARLHPDMDSLQYRYCRLKFTPNNGDLSAGAVTAFITNNIQKYESYADGFTIS